MKPKTIEDILVELQPILFKKDHNKISRGKAKQQLLDLFMSCVPMPRVLDESNIHLESYREAWNDFIGQMIKNLEKLK